MKTAIKLNDKFIIKSIIANDEDEISYGEEHWFFIDFSAVSTILGPFVKLFLDEDLWKLALYEPPFKTFPDSVKTPELFNKFYSYSLIDQLNIILERIDQKWIMKF